MGNVWLEIPESFCSQPGGRRREARTQPPRAKAAAKEETAVNVT